MKYWARFTLKMMARLGLAAAVTAWLATQNNMTYVTVNSAPTEICAGAFGHGWVIRWASTRPSSRWCYLTGYQVEAAEMQNRFDDGFRNHTQILPGVKLQQSDVAGLVFVDHRFVCLTMLVAVIATGVGWRKRETSTETAVETTAETGQE